MPMSDNGKQETEEEDMEQESHDGDNTSEADSEASGDESGSALDDEEFERRRNECLDDMSDLERQFSHIREQLYRERLTQIDEKLDEVREEKAAEYLEPLQQLQEQMKIRTQVSGILRDLRIQGIKIKKESEELAASQHMKSEKMLLHDTIKTELEDTIRRLEEDRHNIDISSDLWNETQILKKNKRRSDPFNPDRRKKPVTITGPYIVYMLQDTDIIDDWTAIRKALKQQSQKCRSEF